MAAAKLARLAALTEGDPIIMETPVESKNDLMEDIEVILPSSEDEKPKAPHKAPPKAELHSDERSKEAFHMKIARESEDAAKKKATQNETKKTQRLNQKHRWCKALRRTQRYLGLLPRQHSENPLSIPNLTWEELQAAQQAYANRPSRATVPALDLSQPAPYPFDNSVVFICIDVESFERNHNMITEIGICTLDTNDLADLAPGEGGVDWQNAIRARHFRIKENSHLVNKDFVAGCADRFEKAFGVSEFISIKDAPQIVASCFKHPFSATLTPFEGSDSNTEEQPNRNVVLVGHDTSTDIAYLRGLGYDVSNMRNLLECLDTATLFRALKYETNSRSLGSILLELGLMGWNLHNAGNDAAYTLQALIGIAVRGLHPSRVSPSEKLEEAVKETANRVKEDEVQWAMADLAGGDGGAPEKHKPGDENRSGGGRGGKGGDRRRGEGGGRGWDRGGGEGGGRGWDRGRGEGGARGGVGARGRGGGRGGSSNRGENNRGENNHGGYGRGGNSGNVGRDGREASGAYTYGGNSKGW
ncbi:Ribonuclease H-like domain [Lasallia pustulata]|uniref:Ribonuclease H-like domain n=1 Tax=Lasallia pustulata TaxID=136370 RepID=A0A1W5DE64_9LECA|nr:Ribonuclease H-like domain [Lasallia pustulata]